MNDQGDVLTELAAGHRQTSFACERCPLDVREAALLRAQKREETPWYSTHNLHVLRRGGSDSSLWQRRSTDRRDSAVAEAARSQGPDVSAAIVHSRQASSMHRDSSFSALSISSSPDSRPVSPGSPGLSPSTPTRNLSRSPKSILSLVGKSRTQRLSTFSSRLSERW
eukprot:TRINITY_DN52944_c0_g1_i1.p1 TRINITY_DN52944_c0_g1~~TRINITY_DN52944_c0_g1_i1.p1  ORF type:complete len:176 (-),score=27.95 TRINITY_DN52944_c0_g1_i1:16-516(-)